MSEDKNTEEIVEKSQESDKKVETPIEDLEKRIEILEKEKDDFKDKWMRSKADYENLEKQSIQRVSQEILKNKLNLLSEFLTIYEDFIRAEDSLSKNNVDTSGIEVIKKNMKKLNDWRDISELVPSTFKKNNKLKRTGLCGIFSASLELTREGLINIMQKKDFDKLLIKEKK